MKNNATHFMLLSMLGAFAAAMIAAPVRAATSDEIENSIEMGLSWLAGQQGPDGSWDEYGCAQVAVTGLVVLKMEDRARELGFDDPTDPAYEYGAHVARGLDSLPAGRTRSTSHPSHRLMATEMAWDLLSTTADSTSTTTRASG